VNNAAKRVRRDHNLTQDEIGELIGVKKSQISKIEKSGRNVTIGTLIRIQEALKANFKIMVKYNNEDDFITV
jgi:HTH-type transcriptional regulator/antitoxin HipB